MVRRLVWVVCVMPIASACSVDDLDLRGRECPCVDGWVCDDARNVCVEASGGDGGAPPDAPSALDARPGVDSGPDVDAGPGADAGPGVDAGPLASRCDGPFGSRLFCDGFESGDTSRWDSVETDGAGEVNVVTDPVYMGASALRVFGDVGAGYGGVWKTVFPASGVTDQWLRGYYYFPTADGFGAEVNSMADIDFDYDVVVAVGSSQINFHTHSWPADSGDGASYAVDGETWTCIELHVHFGGLGEGAIELYFDDTLRASATGVDTTVPTGLQNVVAGFAWKDRDVSNTVYVDEVVADTARVGCD